MAFIALIVELRSLNPDGGIGYEGVDLDTDLRQASRVHWQGIPSQATLPRSDRVPTGAVIDEGPMQVVESCFSSISANRGHAESGGCRGGRGSNWRIRRLIDAPRLRWRNKEPSCMRLFVTGALVPCSICGRPTGSGVRRSVPELSL